MAVAQVVDADALDAGGPAAPFYLVVENDFETLKMRSSGSQSL